MLLAEGFQNVQVSVVERLLTFLVEGGNQTTRSLQLGQHSHSYLLPKREAHQGTAEIFNVGVAGLIRVLLGLDDFLLRLHQLVETLRCFSLAELQLGEHF